MRSEHSLSLRLCFLFPPSLSSCEHARALSRVRARVCYFYSLVIECVFFKKRRKPKKKTALYECTYTRIILLLFSPFSLSSPSSSSPSSSYTFWPGLRRGEKSVGTVLLRPAKRTAAVPQHLPLSSLQVINHQGRPPGRTAGFSNRLARCLLLRALQSLHQKRLGLLKRLAGGLFTM